MRVGLAFGLIVAVLLVAFASHIVEGVTSPVHVVVASPSAGGVPELEHVVIVMEENHAFSQIIGNSQAPYINSLATQGALFTNSHALTHPSQPNYLDLFSGDNQGVLDDSCPHTFSTANLGSELLEAGLTFRGYSEDLPSTGFAGCTSGYYARKHSPWINFTNVPANLHLPFTSFPSDFSTLPTLSFVIPNQLNDMHNGSIPQADTWLQQNLNNYVLFAMTHNSLLVLQWDEDDNLHGNQIATIFVGQPVVPGRYSEPVTHFNVLRTMEDMYNLPHAGQSGTSQPITDVWAIQGLTPTATSLAGTNTPVSTATNTLTNTPTRTSAPTLTPNGTDTVAPTQTPSNATATPVPSITPIPPSPTTLRDTPSPTPYQPTSTAEATSTTCPLQFTDVPPDSPFYSFVRCQACRGIISGYASGCETGDPCFRPNSVITRGQLSKIVSNAAGFSDNVPDSQQTFTDVPSSTPFWRWIERIAGRHIISGYDCGRPGEPCDPQVRPYFRWGANATRGQISKIVSEAGGFEDNISPDQQTYSDVPPSNPFWLWIERLSLHAVMSGYECGSAGEPCDPQERAYFRWYNNATRGQTSKIVTNTFFPNCGAP